MFVVSNRSVITLMIHKRFDYWKKTRANENIQMLYDCHHVERNYGIPLLVIFLLDVHFVNRIMECCVCKYKWLYHKGIERGGGVLSGFRAFNILLYNASRPIYIGCNVKLVSFGLNFVASIFYVHLKTCLKKQNTNLFWFRYIFFFYKCTCSTCL